MSRRLRRVPSNWEHPKKENGDYQPMYDQYYGDALDEWLKNHQMWQDGTHPDLQDNPQRKTEFPFFALWDGDAPEINYYHTKKYCEEDLTHIQLYEDVSEGTPVSPVFKASELENLCEYAAEHCTTFASFKATKEQWMEMLTKNMVFHKQGNIIFT